MKDKPNLTFREMMQHVSQIWKDISPEERAYFDQLSEKDKIRHKKQTQEFKIWSEQNP